MTRLKTHIPNTQTPEYSPFEKSQLKGLEDDYRPPKCEHRTDPSPMYNCHGLVFAARRTCVDASESVWKMIKEDGYEQVGAPALAGDVILYFDSSGDVTHSGIVVGWNKEWQVAQVVSKWGKWREVIHWQHQCPYASSDVRYYRVTK